MSALEGATGAGGSNGWPTNAGEFAARWNSATPERREEIFEAIVQDASSFESEYFRLIVEDAS